MPIDPTKLTQSIVRLFGWVVGEVNWKEPDAHPGYKPTKAQPEAKTAHQPLKSPESASLADAKLLAHVLAFSNEGRYTPFRIPALFLVHDEGEWVWHSDSDKVDPARLGLAQLDQNVVFARNLKFWICDRSAYIRRLDMSEGTLQRMVIDFETGGAQGRRIDLVGQESSYMARLGPGNH
jgi:hypothetical protein